MRIKNKIIFFLTFYSVSLFAQLEKGDKYYNNGEYFKAIPCFAKAARTDAKKDKLEALIKLGNSYMKVNEYAKAENAYREATTIKAKAPAGVTYVYNYAQVLRVNSKYPEAIEQYNNYLKTNPNDAHAKDAAKFVSEIKYYMSKPQEYKIKPVPAINTALSEFAPTVNGDQLIFAAEREVFNFTDFTVNNYNGAPYIHLYASNLDGSEVKKENELEKNFNTELHNGPACVTSDGKTLYFTRVEYKSGQPNQTRIYTATKGKRGWEDIKVVNIGDEEFSVAQPCISPDNTTLYFTSNMPGGYGGKDIYMSRKSGITWTKPVNLGPDINTSGDEMFPSMRRDGVLFFSSTGLPGFGGLDIYSAQKVDNKWILTRNEGMDLNSRFDDFGMSFLSDTTGFFSSNREVGKGSDDIYFYTFRSKAMKISGNVLLTENVNNPAKNIMIRLKEAISGNIIDSMRTDDKGFFEFKNLNSEMTYMGVLDENDPAFNGKARFYLAKDQTVHRVTGQIGRDRFVFKNLAIDANSLPDLFVDDNLTLGGNLLYVDNNTNKPLKNSRLKLVNDYGDVLEYVTTNEFGAFVFRKIPGDQNYLISVEESDINLPFGTKVLLTNKSGKELRSFIVGKDKFNFKLLSAEKNLLKDMEVEDAELLMAMDGFLFDQDKRPITNTKIKIKEENGSLVQEWVTDKDGRFRFRNLDADKSYLFETEEGDPALSAAKRVYIADGKGKIFRMLDIVNGRFSYKIIEADKHQMGSFEVDDPWLQALDLKNKKDGAPLTIVESILYASGDYKPDAAGQTILDKVSVLLSSNPGLNIQIISHTDSRSSDSFNMELSKKRAQTAVDYIAGKGIAKSRLAAIGKGETQLLNRCANGVTCSDDEHKVNRRTEFTITETIKAQ